MKHLLFALLAVGASLVTVPAAYADFGQDSLLNADKAFALSSQVRNADTVAVHWKIAKGYYLYRDKFKFQILSDGFTLKNPVFPEGIRKHDEFLGDVVTYRNGVTVLLPLSRNDPESRTVKMQVTAQGCADLGVCYPPLVKIVDFTLPPLHLSAAERQRAEKQQASATPNDAAPAAGEQGFLQPDQAFQLQVSAQDTHTLLAHIAIAPGYYLYRDKIHFNLVSAPGITLATYKMPPARVKVDPYIGKTEIYDHPIDVTLPLQGDTSGVSAIQLNASYQGCAEKGICYPPVSKTIAVPLSGGNATAAASVPASGETPAPVSLKTYVVAMLAAFGTGLLLTFTPCVLPMIPILSSIIVGQGDRNITKLHSGLLSLTYVLGTAVTYTAAGVLAGATGGQLQAYFQNPYAIGLFSAIFVLLALSMFGFYELQVPAFIQSHLHRHSHAIHKNSHRVKGGAFFGTFALGLFSALIVGACVSPLLISALEFSISSRNPVLGGAIMFSIAMGMGVILIAIGIGAGFLLPKAGPWMDRVKHIFGVLLLGVAIYFLGSLPQVPVLLLWAALLIVTGVYLGATQTLTKDAGGWKYLWKGVGTVMLIWGVLALIGGLSGKRDVLDPLPRASLPSVSTEGTPASQTATAPLFRRLTKLDDVESALAAARAAHKPVVLDFFATWCTDCILLQRGTFSDPRVRAALDHFVTLQADVTDTDADSQAIKQHFGVLGPPAVLLFSADGKELNQLQFYGYRSADEFLATLRQAQPDSGGTPQPLDSTATQP